MSGPETPRKDFVQQIFRVVQVHLDFFQDYLAFFFHILGIELGPQNEIGNDVEGNREMLVEHFGVEANLFFGGEGVQHSTDGIHLSRNSFRGAPLRALEDHVLHEMGRPFSSCTSRREPLRTQTPTETERTWVMVSVMTTRPLGSTCVRMSRAAVVIQGL